MATSSALEPARSAPGAPGPDRDALRALLAPRSVAVAGAMQRHGSAGYEIVRAIRDRGFRGRLYPINGSGRLVCGVPGHRTIADLPEPVDLLVVAAPADRVPHLLREAGRRGIRSAAVLSRLASADGARRNGRRAEPARIARDFGMRLIGPNSLGVVNTARHIQLNASLAPGRPPPGGLALVSQSGTVGIALLEHAERSGCGVAAFVSLGDTPDISCADLLGYWRTDRAVQAVGLYVDSFGSSAAFVRAARTISGSKPVLAIGNDGGDVQEALFERAGILRVAGLDEMMDAARVVVGQPLPTGRRLGIVGNAGELTALSAAAARASGFAVRHLAAAGSEGCVNPLDVGTDATPRQVAEATERMANSAEIDMLLLMIVGTRANVPDAIMTAAAAVLDRHPQLTAATVLTGSGDDIPHLGARRTPVYRQPERAVRALAHASRYAQWRREPRGRWVTPGRVRRERARTLIERARDRGPGWLPRPVTAEILAAYGIAVLPGSTVCSGVGAVTAARELAAGITQAPPLGPVIRLALNRDRVLQAVPLTDLDAGRMWRGLTRASRLAGEGGEGGEGGEPPVDTAALEDLLLRLSCLAEDHPDIAELDLHPLLAGPDGVIAAEARLRFAGGHAEGVTAAAP